MITRRILNALFAASALIALAQNPDPKVRVAVLKQSLQQSQAQLRKYEWIETTVVSLKGEEKSRKQNRCYYGADGKTQKVPIGSAPASAPAPSSGGRGGIGGRIIEKKIEKKKEELTQYMQQAVQLVHQYVPPDPARLQSSSDAGKVSFQKRADGSGSLEVHDYLQPGDAVEFGIDLQNNSLLGLKVKSYLDKADDVVGLEVRLSRLDDGTSYPSLITLDAKAKQVRVTVQNSGYRPLLR